VETLLEVLEKVSIFRRAIDYNDMSDVLADKYARYAGALAAQGCLRTAMNYLSQLNDPVRSRNLLVIKPEDTDSFHTEVQDGR